MTQSLRLVSNCREYIKTTDLIEYVHISRFNMTDLNTTHKRKVCLMVEDVFTTAVTTK